MRVKGTTLDGVWRQPGHDVRCSECKGWIEARDLGFLTDYGFECRGCFRRKNPGYYRELEKTGERVRRFLYLVYLGLGIGFALYVLFRVGSWG